MRADVEIHAGQSNCPATGQEILPAWLQEIINDQGRLTLTDHEAARLLGISRGSLRAAIAEQEIEVVRLGRRLLILLIPLLKLMGVETTSGSDAGDEGPWAGGS